MATVLSKTSKDCQAILKTFYKTVWEIPQKAVIDLAADRGRYVCQSQSMNLFMADVTLGKLNSAHFYGWKKGLKTGMYYLRTQSKAQALKGLGVEAKKKNTEVEEIACSIENPESCEGCGA